MSKLVPPQAKGNRVSRCHWTSASLVKGPIRSGVLGALGILLVAVSGCSTEQEPGADSVALGPTVEWKLVTTWPQNLPALQTAPERLAERVETMSAGRFKIKVYAAGELVPAFEVFDAVAGGTAEMGHGAAYYWRGKLPIAAVFTTAPFGMNAQEMNGWLRFGGGMELWRELYEPFGVVPIATGNSGTQMAGWFNKEIHSLADIQGLKMRIPGLGGEVFSRAGGVAVSMPGSEMFTALQTGVIDATEWIGPYNDLAFGLQKIARYYYYPGWHEPSAVLEAIINQEAWESLPDDLQAILETACTATNQEVLDEFTASNASALKVLVEEHGVEIRLLPDDVLKRFAELSIEVLEEEAQGDDLSKRVLDSYRSFLADMREYHAISEQAYINARSDVREEAGREGG